jgi:hypothetical protein
LAPARFKQPGRRRIKLELEHVEAFVTKAIELGRLSLALGTAPCSLRRRCASATLWANGSLSRLEQTNPALSSAAGGG